MNQKKVSKLTLLTTPWDFSHFKYNSRIIDMFKNMLKNYSEVPAIFLEIMFFLQNPTEEIKKINNSNQSEISWKINKWLHSGNNMSKNIFLKF